jgi:hypothetical protein
LVHAATIRKGATLWGYRATYHTCRI